MMKNTSYIDSLTPLRGIAAIWVVLYHFDQLTTFTGLDHIVSPDGTMLLAKGYLFVDFFFLLSGFILSHVYGDRLHGNFDLKRVRTYLWARFSRLYPLHIFCIVTHVIVVILLYFQFPSIWAKFSHMYALEGLPVHLFLAQAWGSEYWLTWNVPSWSISAEWAIYMISPVLFMLLYKSSGRNQIIGSVFAFIILVVITQVSIRHSLDVTFDFGIFRCFAEFCLGIVAYNIYTSNIWRNTFRKDYCFTITAIALLVLFHFKLNDVFIIPLFVILILAAAHNAGKLQQFMKWKWAQYFGEVSYSIYMMQGLWLGFYWMGLDSWLTDHPGEIPNPVSLVAVIGILLAANVASAIISYQYVEIPAQKWLRGIYTMFGQSRQSTT